MYVQARYVKLINFVNSHIRNEVIIFHEHINRLNAIKIKRVCLNTFSITFNNTVDDLRKANTKYNNVFNDKYNYLKKETGFLRIDYVL